MVRNIEFLIILKKTKSAGLAHLKLSSPAVMLFRFTFLFSCNAKTILLSFSDSFLLVIARIVLLHSFLLCRCVLCRKSTFVVFHKSCKTLCTVLFGLKRGGFHTDEYLAVKEFRQ